LRLQIELDGGNTDAGRVLDLRKTSNQVLASIIWGNVSINVLLTLFSDTVLTGVSAFLFCAVVITLLGEIVPQRNTEPNPDLWYCGHGLFPALGVAPKVWLK
jgi:metal transporter CNNM